MSAGLFLRRMRKRHELRDFSLISQIPSMEPSRSSEGSSSDVSGDKDDRLLRVDEAARLLGISVGSLYHWVSQGRIPCIRLSARCLRFSLPAIREWLDELNKPANKRDL